MGQEIINNLISNLKGKTMNKTSEILSEKENSIFVNFKKFNYRIKILNLVIAPNRKKKSNLLKILR